MVADLRKTQENQWVSEIRIDKSGFVVKIGDGLMCAFARKEKI